MADSLASSENRKPAGNWRNLIVVALWSAVLIGICIRIGLVSRDHDVFATYADAGRKWVNSQPLYSYTRGFVYSPLIAGLFAPFLWFPNWLGGILWRLLAATVFVAGIILWLKAELQTEIPRSRHWLVFLLGFPFLLRNFYNRKENSLFTRLLLIALL